MHAQRTYALTMQPGPDCIQGPRYLQNFKSPVTQHARIRMRTSALSYQTCSSNVMPAPFAGLK